MYQINPEKSFFTIIPNIVDDMSLSPQAFRLYAHIKRVAGESGICWQSGETMSKICNMSTGAISQAKTELVDAGLIEVEQKTSDKGTYSEITITDIWEPNITLYKQGLHNVKGGSSYYETKNNPINNNPIGKPKPEKKPKQNLTQKDYDKVNKFVKVELENATKTKTMGFSELPETYIPYAKSFTESTGIAYLKRYFSDWCSTINDWINLGYQPEDITSAISEISAEGKMGFISRPGSIDWKLRQLEAAKKQKQNDPYKNMRRITDDE